jgi:predicted metal-dependent hydrolase
VIAARRLQRNFADGFLAEAVEDLWEPWMRHADTALEDEALLLLIQQELAIRCKKSKTRGRKATPAEVVLRRLLLKHVRDWSYETLSREVRANLLRGNTQAEEKLLSIFETRTEVIRKGKANKPNEFGKLVLIQEAENQIVYRLSSMPTETRRLHLTDRISGATRRTVRPGTGTRRRRSRILLHQQRIQGRGNGGQARIHSEPRHQKPGSQAAAEGAVVQRVAEIAHWLRRPHQRSQTSARDAAFPLQRIRRHPPLGRTGGDRRQHHSYRHPLG